MTYAPANRWRTIVGGGETFEYTPISAFNDERLQVGAAGVERGRRRIVDQGGDDDRRECLGGCRVRQPGGFYLPNAPRDGKFKTPSARAQFKVHEIPRHELKDGELLLTTVRSHDQFNTTIYSENDRYRGVSHGRRVVFMNSADMIRLGIEKNQWVDLVSHFESETRRAERFEAIPYEIPEGCAAAYFPETNVLVPIRSVAEGSNQPVSKSIVITVEPAGRLDGNVHNLSESSKPAASLVAG